MAKPRVFISSTFYDLKYVRDDLERFVLDLGYEPVRNETGAIPYERTVTLEKSAYLEVERCDIIVCIIGGRFGTESREEAGSSITQVELKTALSKGIQVFIFLEQNIYSEYSTYLANKENKDIKFSHATDRRVYEFIDQILALPKNNPLSTFKSSREIIEFLRSQWAGLFQRFIQEQARVAEVRVLEEVKALSATLTQTINFLTAEKSSPSEAIKLIITPSQPVFRAFERVTDTKYRVFFLTEHELNAWLSSRRWKRIEPDRLDSDSVYEWFKDDEYIKCTVDLFDNTGNLKPFSESEWNPVWILRLPTPLHPTQ